MLIAGFPAMAAETNCWVVALGRGEQCVIVDPGVGVEAELNEIIAEHNLHPVAVLLTHGHIDHVFSVVPVCQARDVPAFIHPSDRSLLTDPWTALGLPKGAPLMGMRSLTLAEPDDVRELADGDKVALAGIDFAVLHTPGHTPGSVVFALGADAEPVLFSGDVLFAGSIGRMDLPGGSEREMMQSLRGTILPLDDATVVHPGHGPSTTVGRERRTNPYLQDL